MGAEPEFEARPARPRPQDAAVPVVPPHTHEQLVRGAADAIISKTLKGIITSWNEGAARLYGYAPDEAVGQHISLIIPPSRRGEELRILDRVIAGLPLDHYQTERLHKDGSIVQVSLTVSPVKDDRGRIVGASAIARDVSAEREAARAMAILASIVASSDDAIISKTTEGIITSWNPAAERLYGYEAHEVIGKPISVIIPPQRSGEEVELLRNILHGYRIEHYETERRRKDGTIVEVSLTLSPVHGPSGEVIGASAIARDITERREFERERAELDRTKSRFVADAAHELRTPLTTLLGYVELLSRRDFRMSDEELASAREALRAQGERVRALVNELLDYSEIELGGRTSPESVVVTDVVQAALASAPSPEAVNVSISASPVAVRGVKQHLERVFVNLLANAYRYGGPNVSIEAGIDGAQGVVLVQDDGPGVPKDVVERLFDPFARGRSAGGSGLGLAIVRRSIESMGGTIEHERRVPSGARFVIRLPLA